MDEFRNLQHKDSCYCEPDGVTGTKIAQRMNWLIVDTDDFELTAKVNQAIIEGHYRGLMSSASLLANGEAFESAMALPRQPCEPLCKRWTSSRARPAPPRS